MLKEGCRSERRITRRQNVAIDVELHTWTSDHVQPSATWFGNALVVEHLYVSTVPTAASGHVGQEKVRCLNLLRSPAIARR